MSSWREVNVVRDARDQVRGHYLIRSRRDEGEGPWNVWGKFQLAASSAHNGAGRCMAGEAVMLGALLELGRCDKRSTNAPRNLLSGPRTGTAPGQLSATTPEEQDT